MRHTRVARRDGLLCFSLHHHDEEHAAFVPAADPRDSPIIDTIAQGNRPAKPKELCLNVHGNSRPHTFMALVWEESQAAFHESSEAALLHAHQVSASLARIASDNAPQRPSGTTPILTVPRPRLPRLAPRNWFG